MIEGDIVLLCAQVVLLPVCIIIHRFLLVSLATILKKII